MPLVKFICHLFIIIAFSLNAQNQPDDNIRQRWRSSVKQLSVQVQNVAAGNQLLPGSDGIVEIRSNSMIKRAKTRDRVALFHNLSHKQEYTVVVYNQSRSTAFDYSMELWGTWDNIIINPSNPALSFTRKMPFITHITTKRSGIDRLNPSFEVGDTVTIDLIINNPSSLTLQSKAIVMLRNIPTSKIYRLENEITLQPNASGHATLQFVTSVAGAYLFAPGVFIMDNINKFSDCWDWSEKPFFYVSSDHRYLEFAGYNWYVKTGFGNPGGNYWSDDYTHVWTDSLGHLHLTLAKKGQNWYCSEVISKETFSYGTYTFGVRGRPAYFDPYVVAGIFLYYNETNEIDIEFSRWGDPDNTRFGNYVVQPAEYPGNHFRFELSPTDTITTHQIIWAPDTISFLSWRGSAKTPDKENIIKSWEYTGRHIPKGGKLRLFFNLWLFRGTWPSQIRNETFTITHFSYIPSDPL